MDSSESIFLNAKNYKDISEKRSVNFSDIEKALDIVRKFIIDKKLLIFGGMAIDLNLKITGHPGIYKENAIPDYDFMSPNFYDDSNELAKILYESGLVNISSINAMHVTSRKVRVNFVPVADISYVPKNIYEKIPFVTVSGNAKNIREYKGLKIVHPDFQRLDLHRSFNIPFSNPPQEVILHRLEKDQKRFRLFDHQFPVKIDAKLLEKTNPFKFKQSETVTLELDKNYLQNAVIGGVINYAILIKFIEVLKSIKSMFYPMIEKSGVQSYIDEKFSQILYAQFDMTKEHIVVNLPSELKKIKKVNVMTDNFQNLVDEIKKDHKTSEVKYYNKFLDNLRPRTIVIESEGKEFEIFDTNGELVPCYNFQKVINIAKKLLDRGGEFAKYEENNENIYLAQPNYLLLYFLQKSFDSSSDETNIYKSLYQSTINLVEIAEKMVLAIHEQEPELIDKIYKYLPFFLPVHTYGEHNWSSDYVALVKEKKYFLSNIPTDQRQILRPPFGYYAEKSVDWIPFDPKNSELFQIDGELRDSPFEPINLDI